ncbi:hypothetical protein ISCGN_026790 [Ixodes scapularis]
MDCVCKSPGLWKPARAARLADEQAAPASVVQRALRCYRVCKLWEDSFVEKTRAPPFLLRIRCCKDLLLWDWSKKAYQRPDGTFGGIPHGQVKIVGSSMAERDSVIARVFQVCILVEAESVAAACLLAGDECTARRVGEFVWNDKPVIPVFCTGKAAAGEHNSSTGVDSTTLRSICENPPPGVDCNTWFLLKNSSSSPEDIGKAVRKIVTNVYRQTKKRPTELPEVLKKVSRPG